MPRKNVKNKRGVVRTNDALFRPANAHQKGKGPHALVLNSRFRETSNGKARPKTGTIPPILTSYVDPFCDDALGIRYPDAFRGLSGTFNSVREGRLRTPGAVGTFTDLNMAGVTPTPGTTLMLFTPDPSNIMIQGVSGNNASGYFAGIEDMFHWPNGIVFTNQGGTKNSFGPGTGRLSNDYVLPNINLMRDMYSGSRLVSGGVKLTGTMNFSTVSGTVHMAPIFVSMSKDTNNNSAEVGGIQDPTAGSMTNGWQTTLPSSFADMCNLPGYASFPLSALGTDEIVAIFKRSGEEALLFKPVTSIWGAYGDGLTGPDQRYGNSNIPNNYGHYCVLLYVDGVLDSTGGPSAENVSLLEYQIHSHYECQFSPGVSARFNAVTTSGGQATKAAPYQPLLLAAADNLSADIPAIRCVDDAGIAEMAFMKEVARAWKGAVSVAGSVATAVELGSALLGALTI